MPDKPKYIKPVIIEVTQTPRSTKAIKKVKRSAETKIKDTKQVEFSKNPVIAEVKNTPVSVAIVEKAKLITLKQMTIKTKLKTKRSGVNRLIWRSN